MFVEDLKKDFYNLLLGKRVFMAVQTGVDAACAAYALAGLLRGAGVAHSVAGVRSAAEAAARAGGEAAAPVLLLVGCGATEDLAALLQPPPEQIIFVLDSHRPSHVCNVYSDGQIRLLYRDPDEDIPDFDDIFRDDSDDEDNELDNMTDLEARAAAAARRRERAGWERKRHELMFNYTQFTYFATPMAVIASELCWQVGVAKQAAWATCVSLAYYRGTALRAQAQCALDEHRIHHALRHPDIAVGADAWVPLYREWSIFGALGNHLTVPLAPLLADMGYPLAQAKQAFCAMDVELRNKFVASLEAALQRRGLPGAAQPARLLRRPHARPRSALDDAAALMALCEHSCPDRALQQSFSCLAGDAGARGTGLELAKGNITAITQLAQHYSFNRNPPAMFLHLTLECSISSRLRGPIWLREVARRVRKKLPTVVSCDRPDGTCLMIGLPPSSDTRNIFGAAFDQAASESNVTIWREYADAELVTMKSEHRNSFVDALTALLS